MAHLFYYDAGKTESNIEVIVGGVKVLDGDFKQISCEYADASCAFVVFMLEGLAADRLAADRLGDENQKVRVEVFLDSVARDQKYLISSVRFGKEHFTFDRFATGEVKFVQDDPVGCMPVSGSVMVIDAYSLTADGPATPATPESMEEPYRVMEVSL